MKKDHFLLTMDYVRNMPRGGIHDSASLSSGFRTDFSSDSEKKIYHKLRLGFIDPQTSRLNDKPANNRSDFYDPFQQRDTLQAYNILHGLRQWPFITAEDLIQRAPERVFIGHSVHLNPLDARNYNPSQALADFVETVDRYREAPLGADIHEHPQLTYLRDLEDLKHDGRPSLQTLTSLYGMHIDRGAQSYIAELNKSSAIELTKNDMYQQQAKESSKRLKHRLHKRHIQVKHAHLRLGHKHKKRNQKDVPFNAQQSRKEQQQTSVLDYT